MENKFLLKNHIRENEIRIAIKNSVPIKKDKMPKIKIDGDFNYGKFVIQIQDEKINYSFQINNETYNFNDFINFLEFVLTTNEDCILCLFCCGLEYIIYLKSLSIKSIRFIVLDANKADNKLQKFSYANSETKTDIIIGKRAFYKEFYLAIRKMFVEYESIAYFEPPVINFDFWKKDSEIIKKFLKIEK